ncbi:MAG: type I-E CRISPR-associated protein Cas6/Cse3/CasE [Mycolicibacterium sp.]|nr:type I-E CRISPR-associated protein Cas6/Cse3/CasE [Mycolicibacterium sp.]
MFLSRMFINPRKRGGQRLLASPQRMHAAVEAGFPPHTFENGVARPLWRIDRQNDDVALFVVSPVEPDLTHLVEQAGWQTGELWQTRPYSPLLNSLAPGQSWQFRLTANPTYFGRKDGWSDTKPRAHTTVKQQERWLLDRCAKAGFSIPDGPTGESELRILERGSLRFSKGGHTVSLATATYEGHLVVSDADQLRATLSQGLGRAKAYGCGLLTLAPRGDR